jgi:4-amino-4-deoxychorismate lyase
VIIKTLVNGEPAGTIPVDDRGFMYGDMVFETMLSDGQKIPLWDWHWARLMSACHEMGFNPPEEELCLDEVRCLIDGSVSIIKLMVTRGSSQTGYWLPKTVQMRRIVEMRPRPASVIRQRQAGLCIGTGELRLPSAGPLAGIKHGGRVMQVLLAQECQQRGLDELLVCREDDLVAEAIACNVLAVIDDVLVTPVAPDVSGVGLRWLAAQGVDITTRPVRLSEMRDATELILINSVSGIRSVVRWDERVMTIGSYGQELQTLWSAQLP